jgi:hypothetical protein
VARNKPIRISIVGQATRAQLAIKQTSKALEALGKATKGAAKIAAPLASVASLAGPATTATLALGKAMVAVGKAAAATAPVVAFAAPAVAGFLLLKRTVTQVGIAMGEAFKPVADRFLEAEKAASLLATRGLAAIGKEFNRVNMPAIAAAMRAIATTANENVRVFGRWVNSAAGVRLIRSTTEGVTRAFNEAAPAITNMSIALLEMGNRAKIARRFESLGEAVAAAADKVTAWANSQSAQDITRALQGIADAGQYLTEKLTTLRDMFGVLADNSEAVKKFTTVLAGLGLALSIYTLNPVGVAIASFTLLANNWDTAKKAFNGAADFVNGIFAGVKASPALTAFSSNALGSFGRIRDGAAAFGREIGPAFATVVPALKKFGTAILPTLSKIGEDLSRVLGPALAEIGKLIREDLAPAFSSFLTAVTPIAKFLLGVFGSALVGALKGVVGVIKGAITIISGLFNLISGILTGDWSKAWQGIKQIVSGAFTAIVGAIQVFLNIGVLRLFKLGFSLLKGIVVGGWNLIKGGFTGALSALRGLVVGAIRGYIGFWRNLFTAVKTIVVNGWKALRSAFGGAFAAIKTVVSTSIAAVRNGIVTGFRTAVTKTRDGITKVVDFVKGLPQKIKTALGNLGNLLTEAGRKVLEGFLKGLTAKWEDVKGFFADITSKIPDLKGPAARDRKLLFRNGTLVLGGFEAGLRSKYGSVKKSLRDFTRGLADKRDVKVIGDAFTKAFASIQRQVAKQRQVVADLVRARRDYAREIKDSLRGGGLSAVQLDTEDLNPRLTLVNGLKQRLAAIRDFQRQLKVLSRKGLSKDLIRQIADLGLEGGAQYLTALAGATPDVIRQFNRLNSAIAAAAGATGNQVAGNLFNDRIRAERAELPPQKVVLELKGSDTKAGRLLIELLRDSIRKQGRGGKDSVQLALG